MKKIYPDAAAALDGLLFDEMLIAADPGCGAKTADGCIE